jgi:hypothetical protein
LRNNSLLGLTSRLAPKPPKQYTVGLNIIDDKAIDGVGSVYYLGQSTSNGGNGNQAFTSYYSPFDSTGNGYYNIENESSYYEIISQPIPTI